MSTKPTANDDSKSQDNYTRESVSGGVLVYEVLPDHRGRKLAGFEDVDDWDEIRSALIKRGHGVGAIYHLPEIDA